MYGLLGFTLLTVVIAILWGVHLHIATSTLSLSWMNSSNGAASCAWQELLFSPA
jgi:hypothetical protein